MFNQKYYFSSSWINKPCQANKPTGLTIELDNQEESGVYYLFGCEFIYEFLCAFEA